MSEQMSLGGILNEQVESSIPVVKAPETPQVVESAPETPNVPRETSETRERGPDGKFVAKEETPPEPVVEPTPAKVEPVDVSDREKAAIARAMDERRKRQELEGKLAEMQKEPPKQFWDDPEGALNTFRNEIKQVQVNTVLNTTEALARSTHPDFDEKIAIFAEIVQQTPGIQQQWLSSPNPAEYAYNLGKNHMELRQAGDLNALRAKMEKEIRIKVESEFAAKQKQAQDAQNAIPGSLTNSRSVGSPQQVWNGPTSLDSIIGKA
jgi:hypothetical protein